METISGYTFGLRTSSIVNTLGKATGAAAAFLFFRAVQGAKDEQQKRLPAAKSGKGKGEASSPPSPRLSLLHLTPLASFAGGLNLGPFNAQSLDKMIRSNPLRSTVLIRMSVLPELVKNYILASYGSLPLPTFYLGVLLHGGPYSLLWSYLGSELAGGGSGEMGTTVKVLVGAFGIAGLVGSPVLIAKYTKDL